MILDMMHVLIRCRRALKNSDGRDKQELMGRASKMVKMGIPMLKRAGKGKFEHRKTEKMKFRCLKEQEQGSLSIGKRKKSHSDAWRAENRQV